MIEVFGAPRRIICDKGKAFDNHAFKTFCQEHGIRIHYNATALPRGNGQVERYNRTLLESMSTMGADADDDEWDQNLPNIQLGLNGTVNSAIGVTPSEALMGYRVYSQIMLEGEGREVVDVTRVRDRMVAATESYQADQKRRFDRHRSKARQYSQNDLVLIRVTCSPATGTSRKLCAKWRGPFRVTAVLGHDRYAVQDIPGATRSRVSYSGTCGAENMRPWIHVEEPTDTKGKHSEQFSSAVETSKLPWQNGFGRIEN
jgi:hypothetical protein